MRGVYVLGVVVALATAPLFAETKTDDYTFRYSTLDRVGELAVRATSEAKDLSFTLDAETFDKAIQLETEWRPVAFVPPEVTVTAISVAIPGTDAPASLTVTPPDGGTAVTFKLTTGDAESVTLTDTDGTTDAATLRTYTSEGGVTLAPGQACGFVFDDTEVGTTPRNFYTFGDTPHLRVTGTADITRHVITIDDGREYTLSDQLGTGFEDEGNHVIVVEFSGAGGTLSVDQPLEKAPLVIGSSVPADQAAVNFHNDFSVPLSLRDGDTGSGGITLTLPQYHQGDDHFFGPSALLLDCDLTLKSLVPLIEGSWLTTYDVPIPAGRTFRLELSEADFATAIADEKSESLLPSLSFADATSRLELATQATTAAENPLGIPAKYQNMLNTQSGTLVLDRDVEASSGSFLATVQNLDTTLILTGDHTFDFGTLFTADDWSEYGRPSNFRTLPSSKKAARVLLVRNSLSTPRSVTLSAWRVVRAQSGLC